MPNAECRMSNVELKGLRIRHSSFDNRHSMGFTFVELLIAATMIAVMFVGLSTHLQGGLMVWQRVTTHAEVWQQRRMAINRLQRDFANAVVYDDQGSAFGLEPGQVPRPEFSEQAAQFVTRASTTALPGRLLWVRYACETHENQPGLWRSHQTLGEARIHRPITAMERLLENCDGFSFAYAYMLGTQDQTPQLTWRAQWPVDSTDQDWMKLPRLVMVSLRHQQQALRYEVGVPQGLLKTLQETTP